MNNTSLRCDYKSAHLNLQSKSGDTSFSRFCLPRILKFQKTSQILMNIGKGISEASVIEVVVLVELFAK